MCCKILHTSFWLMRKLLRIIHFLSKLYARYAGMDYVVKESRGVARLNFKRRQRPLPSPPLETGVRGKFLGFCFAVGEF